MENPEHPVALCFNGDRGIPVEFKGVGPFTDIFNVIQLLFCPKVKI